MLRLEIVTCLQTYDDFLSSPYVPCHFNFPFKPFMSTSRWSGKGRDQVSIRTVEGLTLILLSVPAASRKILLWCHQKSSKQI